MTDTTNLIVEAVLRELEGRKGIGDELDALDPDIREDLEDELKDRVQDILDNV